MKVPFANRVFYLKMIVKALIWLQNVRLALLLYIFGAVSELSKSRLRANLSKKEKSKKSIVNYITCLIVCHT